MTPGSSMPTSMNDSIGTPGSGARTPSTPSSAASSSTRSNGTCARSMPPSKDACAASAVSANELTSTATAIGTRPVNQPVVMKSAWVRRVVVGVITE